MSVGTIQVKVNPKARVNKVAEDGAGGYIVWTTTAPDKGKATEAVARALAEHLGVPRRCVVLKSGELSRHKVFEIFNP